MGTLAVEGENSAVSGEPALSGALPGSVVEGTVTGITHFGAFVTLDGGASGLIHISELAHQYVRDVREHVQIGQRVTVKVLQLDAAHGRLELSLKQMQAAPPEALPQWGRKRREKVLADGADPAFEQKLSKFLKSSEERLHDLKRNLETKRGGGRFR